MKHARTQHWQAARILLTGMIAILVLGAVNMSANAQVDSVPIRYRALYDQIKGVLGSVDAHLDTFGSSRQPQPITFAAELIVANCNRGSALLAPQTMSAVRLYLDRLLAMGVQAIKFCIHYPMLTTDFPRATDYLNFYTQVVQESRKRNMKVVIQQNTIFANTPFTDLPVNYAGLTIERFKIEFRVMTEIIVQTLRPDYLILLSEPDTAANLTGLRELALPARALDVIQYVLKDLDRGTTLIGAGSGSWSPIGFAERYARETSLDVLSIHIYPISEAFIDNALRMAELARENGKRVIINEAWLYKTVQLSGGNNVAASSDVFRLDAYSFWSPLDQQFLGILAKLARVGQIELISPYWSNYFFGYVEYRPALDRVPYQELQREANQIASKNLQVGALSATGAYYKQLITSSQ